MNTGWVMGNAGTLFKTSNGGDLWFQQTVTGLSANITSMSMINSNTGWIVTSNFFEGRVFKTIDSGENWIEQTPLGIRELFDIQMIDENTGYICGDAALKKTTNGGENWENIINPFPLAIWYSLKIENTNDVFLASSTVSMRSTNGGSDWTYNYYPVNLSRNVTNCKIDSL